MDNSFLITGIPGPLSLEIARAVDARNQRVVVTHDPALDDATADAETGAPPERLRFRVPDDLNESVRLVDWARRSPLSVRSVIVEASEPQFPEHTIVLLNGYREPGVFHELTPSRVEYAVDFSIKAVLFLVKELVRVYLQRKSGSLNLVVHRPQAAVDSPIDVVLHAALGPFGDALFLQYSGDAFALRGVESDVASIEEVARFVLATIDEASPKTRGRWVRHATRSGFLRKIAR